MYSPFPLRVLTPEREFLQTDVQALTFQTLDGEITLLAGHEPVVIPLAIGVMRILEDGVWHEAFNSEGFLEVSGGFVQVFCQACEWPHEIDTARAQAALDRAREHLRQQEGVREFHAHQISLARAMARLHLTGRKMD